MDSTELAKMSYEIAHSEYNNRIRQRDAILLVFLAAAGTVFGVALGTAKPSEMLLIIPLLAVGCAILVAHHSLIIGSLFEYCYFELHQYLTADHDQNKPPIVERSMAMERIRDTTIRLRSWGHIIVLGAPCIFALLFNSTHAFVPTFPETVGWWGAFVCTFVAIATIYKMNRDRIISFQKARSQMAA